jgi:hypothetical protein
MMTSVDTRPDQDVSANASPIYTLFDVVETPLLTREHILQLAAGVAGAVLVKGFSGTTDCADVMAALDDSDIGTYDERLIYPPIAKLGPAAYDFYGEHELDERYFVQARRSDTIRSTLLRGVDPMEHAVARVRAAWGGPVEPATSGGRPMFAGMIREINVGAKLHFDEITREFPGVLDATPASFLSLNWYLSMPEAGGETSVFRHPWRPSDEADRDGYGYAESVVDGDPVATAHPEPGDALLFDTRNLHLVRPNRGPGRRVTVSFFLGVAGDDSLRVWS